LALLLVPPALALVDLIARAIPLQALGNGSGRAAAGAYGATVVLLGAWIALASAGNRRRLELLAGARLEVCLYWTATAACAGFATSVALGTTVARAAHLAIVLGASGCVQIANARDAAALVPLARHSLVLGAFGVGWVGALAMASQLVRNEGVALAAIATVGCLVFSRVAPDVAATFGPDGSRLLRACSRALRAGQRSDPSAARAAVLRELRMAQRPTGVTEPRDPAVLLLADPPRLLSTDDASYPQWRAGDWPKELLPLAAAEPFGVLRIEVLRALAHRTARLRPLLSFCEDWRALAVVVVRREDDVIGGVLVPAGARDAELTVEEATALASVADCLSANSEAAAALERSHARELEATVAREAADERLERVLAERLATASSWRHQNEALSETLVGPYAPSARTTLDRLIELARQRRPAWLIAAPGVRTDRWVAAAMVHGGLGEVPLVRVDGTLTAHRAAHSFASATSSPLTLAHGGVLLLEAADALPSSSQEELAQGLRERRAHGASPTPLTAWLLAEVRDAPARLVESGAVVEPLWQCLGGTDGAIVVLPTLADRGEDLHALLADRVARAGLRVRGVPLGIEPAALALLVDGSFAGDETTVDALCLECAVRATGPVVTRADVHAAVQTRVSLSPPTAA
jgi:hypothetical protein